MSVSWLKTLARAQLWIGTAAVLGIVALTLVIVAKRRAVGADLGSVSQNWIAENRADSR